MKASTSELIDVARRYYPQGVPCSDPRYSTSEEHLRLKDARRRAADHRGPWRAMLQRLRERLSGHSLKDNVLLCPAEALSSGYSCRVVLPPTSGEHQHGLVLVMSFLVPQYVVYSERYVVAPEPPPPPPSDVVDVYIGDTMYVVPVKAVTPGLRDVLKDEAEAHLAANPEFAAILAETESRPTTERTVSFILSDDERPFADEMAREIEETFGYERMPPEVGSVVVPDVETSDRVFGEATLYDCLLSDG